MSSFCLFDCGRRSDATDRAKALCANRFDGMVAVVPIREDLIVAQHVVDLLELRENLNSLDISVKYPTHIFQVRLSSHRRVQSDVPTQS